METIHGICITYDLDFSTYPWPSWGKRQFCHNKDGSSSWQWSEVNSYDVRFELGSNHLMQIIDGKCLHLSFLRRKNEVIKNESNGKSTTSLCSPFQWLIILSVKKKKAHISHLNFLWLWLQTFVLIILSSTKSQNHFSTQFLTRKNPIHYNAFIPLILFNKLNRLSSLSLHPIFFQPLDHFYCSSLHPFQFIHIQCGYQQHTCPARSAFPVFMAGVDTISLSLPI